MKKFLVFTLALLGILILFLNLNAEENFMWEVENGTSKMYLLGSVHLMPESSYPLDQLIEDSFANSDILVIEADPTSVDPEQIQKMIVEKAMYPEGESLQSSISPELYDKVSAIFTKNNVPMQQINVYKPWFVSLNLAAISMQLNDMKAGIGIDVHFIEKAKEKEMNIMELESATFQMNLITSFADKEQIEYLEYSVDDFYTSNDLIKTMLEAWENGDSELMLKSTKLEMLKSSDELPGMGKLYKKMFSDRDKNIVEKLEGFLKDTSKQTYFVIVGSGHLIGDDGLLKLLEEKGYKTKQM